MVQIKYWPFYLRRNLCAPSTKRPTIQKWIPHIFYLARIYLYYFAVKLLASAIWPGQLWTGNWNWVQPDSNHLGKVLKPIWCQKFRSINIEIGHSQKWKWYGLITHLSLGHKRTSLPPNWQSIMHECFLPK